MFRVFLYLLSLFSSGHSICFDPLDALHMLEQAETITLHCNKEALEMKKGLRGHFIHSQDYTIISVLLLKQGAGI